MDKPPAGDGRNGVRQFLAGVRSHSMEIGLGVLALGVAVFGIWVGVSIASMTELMGGLVEDARSAGARTAVAAEQARGDVRAERDRAERARREMERELDAVEARVVEVAGELDGLEARALSRVDDAVREQLRGFHDEAVRKSLLAAASVAVAEEEWMEGGGKSRELALGEWHRVDIVTGERLVRRFRVKVGGVYELSVRAEAGDGGTIGPETTIGRSDEVLGVDPVIYVYAGRPWRLLDVNDNGGGGGDAVAEVPLMPGDYYAVIEDLDGGSGECIVEIRMTGDLEH